MDKKTNQHAGRGPTPNPGRTMIIWIVMAGVFFAIFSLMGKNGAKSARKIPVSELVTMVEKGQVKEVVFSGPEIAVTAASDERLASYASDREELIKLLLQKKVKYSETPVSQDNSQWLMMLLKILLPMVFLFWIFKSMGKAADQQKKFSASKHKKQPERSPVRFTDVAGCDEAVHELRCVVDYLKDPGRFSRVGARPPKGVMLFGPPGTGKTLLARAVAGEAGVPFLSLTGSDFVEMFVGVGASRVRDLFEDARRNAPCIVFIDEIDGVARHRSGGGMGNSHDEREQTLNAILSEMDGFEPNAGIVTIAATNRPDILDEAMMRAGRFDRKVYLPVPDVKGREAILRVHAKDKPFDGSVDLNKIARDTYGMTGADLANLINEAAVYAAEHGQLTIGEEAIRASVDKIILGSERKSAVLTPEIRKITANHEAGHAVTGWFSPESDPPRKVTIIPRGQALGVTAFRPEGDRQLHGRGQLTAMVVTLLGGRIAEELTNRQLDGRSDITTGASNDLQRATALARSMVCEFAMDEDLDLRTYGARNLGALYQYGGASIIGDYSEETARKIDAAVDRLLRSCREKAEALIKERRPLFDKLVEALLAQETLDDAEIEAILGPRPLKAT